MGSHTALFPDSVDSPRSHIATPKSWFRPKCNQPLRVGFGERCESALAENQTVHRSAIKRGQERKGRCR